MSVHCQTLRQQSPTQHNRLQRVTCGQHPADDGGVHIAQSAQRRHAVLRALSRHAGQQATGSLRVKNQQVARVIHHGFLVARRTAQAHAGALQRADHIRSHAFLSLSQQWQRVEVKFDTLTARAQRAIDLLQGRRTVLISAAVTGQIDVQVEA